MSCDLRGVLQPEDVRAPVETVKDDERHRKQFARDLVHDTRLVLAIRIRYELFSIPSSVLSLHTFSLQIQ